MNIKKYIILLCLLIFSITNANNAFALNSDYGDYEMNTGFEVKEYDNPDLDAFSSKVKLGLLVFDYDGKIENFDVNENGDIVVAYETVSIEKKVCVYNSLGEFQYGYSLLDFGTIGVEWDGENVIIYSVRGAYLVLLDKYANILDKKIVLNTTANNTYRNKTLWKTEKMVGSDKYRLKNSKIIKTTPDQKEFVIIDKSQNHYFSLLFFVSFFVFLIIGVTIVMICFFRNYGR